MRTDTLFPVAPLFRSRLVGELSARNDTVGIENDAVRCWTLPAPHPQDVLILSFKSKMHTLGPDVVRGIVHAVDLTEQSYGALAIGQLSEPFSAGADLKAMLPVFASGGAEAGDPVQRDMQAMSLGLRYAEGPGAPGRGASGRRVGE